MFYLWIIGRTLIALYCFYLKPQHDVFKWHEHTVASYLDSTSNHNITTVSSSSMMVASYLDSTSNHNCLVYSLEKWQLLHILILHQTTTIFGSTRKSVGCFIFWFYIKPQLCSSSLIIIIRCFIFWFYIKPQLSLHPAHCSAVASYFDSTSNHN